jgi:adhesin transport system outer membrane protein
VRTDAGPRTARTTDGGTSRADAQHTSVDGGTLRADAQHAAADAGHAVRDAGARTGAVNGAPEPATHIAVQEPAAPDAGAARKKKARADRTDGQSDPAMDALLEQSRQQTEALQQIAAQQRASEEGRAAEQQARTQRASQIDGARYSIGDTVQSLQANGSWDASALRSTRTSLQQTAAAASAAGSPAEARSASEAARLVEAAEAALAQRNAQQAQYYLLQANQLLIGGQGGGSRY